jgi:hypothetical protein
MENEALEIQEDKTEKAIEKITKEFGINFLICGTFYWFVSWLFF